MKMRVLFVLVALALLSGSMAGCTANPDGGVDSQPKSQAAPSEELEAPGGEDEPDELGFAYTGDGYDLLFVTEIASGEAVAITTDGEVVLRLPGAEWGFYLGEGLVFAKDVGVVNFEGEYLFGEEFENVGGFVDGLAYASTFGEGGFSYGFIDTSGEYAIEPQFSSASGFREGFAAVCFKDEDDWGFIDPTGEVVLRGYGRAWSFCDGLAVVKLKESELFGYIDHEGQFVIEPIYQSALSFSEGLAAVAEPTEDFADRKWGYIGLDGEYVLQPAYGTATAFYDGIAYVSFGDYADVNYQLIDVTGDVAVDTVFNMVVPMGQDVYWVRETDTLEEYFMDSSGAKILAYYRIFH